MAESGDDSAGKVQAKVGFPSLRGVLFSAAAPGAVSIAGAKHAMKRLASFTIVALTALGLMTLTGVSQAATATFYATRSAFDTAAPGLPLQTFAAANLFGQTYVTQTNGLDSATSDAVFPAGSILPGLTLSTLNPGTQSTALEVYSGGPIGKSVGNNWFGDTLVLSFAPGVSAVGEDVFANTSSGPSFAGKITEEIFDRSISLGAKTLTEASGGSVFIGVTSTTLPITAVDLTWASEGDASTFVNNIAFGSPGGAPEPASWALMLVGVALVGATLRSRQARYPANA